jgi:coproporphyrinogen III oxidase-like Fe-S oxidoreductase
VAEEMEILQRLGAKYVFLVDSVFNTSAEHVAQVCEAFIRRNLSIKWGCFLRPQGLTSELVDLMARSGLSHAEFGSDSFCDEVLQAYGKGFTFADILESSEQVGRKGIDYCHFLICGGPSETWETLQIGFRNSQRLNEPVILAVVGLRVYPQTPLCDRLVREGVFPVDQDWLTPVYALGPGLTEEAVFAQLREFSRQSPYWIVGDPAPAYGKLVERLRQRGVTGPLWSYMAMLQRIMPPSSGSS